MKNHGRCILTSLLLVALSWTPLAQPLATGPAGLRVLRETLAERSLDATTRLRVESLLYELGPLLERLPLDELRELEVTEKRIEFVFDYDKARKVALPSVKRTVHDIRRGKLREVECDGATLRFAPRLRFDVIDGEFHLRKGDIEVKKFFWFDLSVRTETRPEQVVRDSKDRPVVRLDAGGQALRDADGRYAYVRTSRWLVLEAKGRRIESALPLTF